MWVQSLGGEDPLEEGMATCSSILAWKIPWTKESGRLQTIGRRVGHDRGDLVHNRIKKQCEFLQSPKCFLCKEVRGLFG